MRALVLLLLIVFDTGVAAAQAPEKSQPTGSDEDSLGTAARGPTGDTAMDTTAPAEAIPVEESMIDPALLGAEGELTEKELHELGFNVESPAVDTSVKLSGFMDFNMETGLTNGSRQITGKPAFAIGNLNVYISKNIVESVRTMAEIRFSYLPNGSPVSFIDQTRISTTAEDYRDFHRPIHWGGIEIERVYLDWSPHRLLTVRLGQFLTPYGVWNVDHGSPTVISYSRPYVIGNAYFPERQTGIELFGRWEASSYGVLGYHLTLSNGEGPATEYLDLDKNKAVGGRVYYEYKRMGDLKIGASIYYGQDTDNKKTTVIGPSGPAFKETITNQANVLAMAADLTWKYEGFHIQIEWIGSQTAFTEEGRTLRFGNGIGRLGYPSDTFAWGGYALIGYRFKWLGVMPYIVSQVVRGRDPALQAEEKVTPLQGGFNIRPIDAIAIKLEYLWVPIPSFQKFPPDDLHIFGAQVAWAF